MTRSSILPLLALALVACGDQLAPVTSGSNIVHIGGGDSSAQGALNGTVFGNEYGAGWDTLSAPIGGITVEIYELVPAEEMLMTSPFDTLPDDTLPADTSIVIDTIPGDTVIVDTMVVDTIVGDSLPPDTLPPVPVLRGSAMTDDEGHFTITGIPAGQYVIHLKPAEDSKWAPLWGWTFESDGAATEERTFHLWPKDDGRLD